MLIILDTGLNNTFLCDNYLSYVIPKFWQGKTLANWLFQRFGEENVSEFTIANVSYFSKSGIWLGKILANDACFAKFAKVFSCQNFELYSNYSSQVVTTQLGSYYTVVTTIQYISFPWCMALLGDKWYNIV